MRPIEPGCRAVVVNSIAGNEGAVVRVLRFYGNAGCFVSELEGCPDKRHGALWEIDTVLRWSNGKSAAIAEEQKLRRIDEDWGKTTQWDESIWSPHKQGVTA